MVITDDDCGTSSGLLIASIIEGGEVVLGLGARVLGRTAHETWDQKGNVIIAKGTLIDEEWVERLDEIGVDEMWVRSPIMCETSHGVCRACYGRT